jgi:histidinol phosphatase-like enzyme
MEIELQEYVIHSNSVYEEKLMQKVTENSKAQISHILYCTHTKEQIDKTVVLYI